VVLVLIKGAGDLASGVAHRLVKSGFKVVMTEIAQPTMVRRTVSYGEAVYDNCAVVEGVTARKVSAVSSMHSLWEKGEIPVVVDPQALIVEELKPDVIVDAILAKRNTGTFRGQAPLTIGLGPGFTAGQDVDVVVETMRGHYLGTVIYSGSAMPDTGVPGEIGSHSIKRLLRAPAAGIFKGHYQIGDQVSESDVVGEVAGSPVQAQIAGVLRGLIRTGTTVFAGMKIGDIDPRGKIEHCFSISDKARAIAGGVLEAILSKIDNTSIRFKDF